MREIQITVSPNDIAYATPGAILGRAGEQGATRVLFDVSAWEDGPYSVAGQNAAGVAWILEPTLTANDGVVTVDMPDAMVGTAGMARIEIRAETGGRICKAASIMLPVTDALTEGAAPAADPAWIDVLSQAAVALGGQIETGAELYAEMEAARDRAEEYAGYADEDAQQVAADKVTVAGYKDAAAGSASEAAGSATAADESADRAEAIYDAFALMELSVDVSSGTLNLYGVMDGSIIDIVLNDRTLEVYKV